MTVNACWRDVGKSRQGTKPKYRNSVFAALNLKVAFNLYPLSSGVVFFGCPVCGSSRAKGCLSGHWSPWRYSSYLSPSPKVVSASHRAYTENCYLGDVLESPNKTKFKEQRGHVCSWDSRTGPRQKSQLEILAWGSHRCKTPIHERFTVACT